MTLSKGETENFGSNSRDFSSDGTVDLSQEDGNVDLSQEDGTVDLSQDWPRNYLNFLTICNSIPRRIYIYTPCSGNLTSITYRVIILTATYYFFHFLSISI
jgi:hypothetical protein